MGTPIPEGYELLAGRSRENAREAIKLAEERGFESSQVRTSTTPLGYLIPEDPNAEHSTSEDGTLNAADLAVVTAESVEVPTDKNTVAEIDAFADKFNITVEGTKPEKVAAINAEIERRTKIAEETGVLTDGTEPAGTDGADANTEGE